MVLMRPVDEKPSAGRFSVLRLLTGRMARWMWMIGLYFSGTGNSRYAAEKLLEALDYAPEAYAIEDEAAAAQLARHEEILLAYPVQYSDVPMILRQFISDHAELWRGKRVFVVATMALFSGDGAGALARLLRQHGATVTGGLHLMMPDSIADEKVLKRTPAKTRRLVDNAGRKIARAADSIRRGKAPRQGLGPLARLAGFLAQRLWFGHRTRKYHTGLKIDTDKCIGCGCCARLCPTWNITMCGGTAQAADRCTLCYRCVNLCPGQAITLLGHRVICQTSIEKHR